MPIVGCLAYCRAMAVIHVLPSDVINKIAAGEVVERPASVVKELVENSLDAGATQVTVELEDGGRERIRVVDDGRGMGRDDALLALERHATSKLADAEGLFSITSFGFRGEAVPAIASVSRLVLVTREPGSVEGTKIEVEGGRIVTVEPCGAPTGTSFDVRDLFFATPARRKFLKRAATETTHASEALVRLALARPDVGFTLRSGGRVTFTTPAGGDFTERIALAIGRDAFPHLLPFDHGSGPIRVRGHAASPDWSAATNAAIYTFVNGRFVRDRQLLHAIGRAYADVLPAGRQPGVVLFLEVPPAEVDVNVHPQKLEVRFAEPRAIYDAVYRALSETLRTTPWLRRGAPGRIAEEPAPAAPGTGPARSYAVAASTQAPFDWHARARAAAVEAREAAKALWPREGDAAAVASGPAAPLPDPGNPGATADPGDGKPPGYFSALRYIGQLARTYLVCEAPGGTLVVLDQHAAHERLTFHRLREAFRARKVVGQPFLFPAMVELGVADARVLSEALPALAELGFELEPFGGTTLALKAVPAELVGADYPRVLGDLARELSTVGPERAFEAAVQDMLATMACHASVRAHEAMTPEEARTLLDDLDQIDFMSRCPHGRPVVAELSLAELEKKVQRR